jgi:hypothetical protein
MLKTYLQTYKGEIVDIEKKVSRRYDDENSTPSTYVRYFAKIKQDDGTIKKVDFHNGWKVGDYVEKLRWHFTPDVKKKLKK